MATRMVECELPFRNDKGGETVDRNVISWKCEAESVTLQVARSKSGEEGLLIENESWNKNCPCEVNVVPNQLEMIPYGSLQVKEENGEYHVIVKPDAVHGGDLSFEFKLYTTVGGNPQASQKPPMYMLFESRRFTDFFMAWDLHGTAVKCKHLSKTPMGLPDITVSSGGYVIPKQIESAPGVLNSKQYVWVIPTDERSIGKFALQPYGRSLFLVFGKANNKAVLMPGDHINQEVSIFKIRNLSL